jgi:integrase
MQKDRNIVFDGPFADLCIRFIDYKRSLGYAYENRERYAVKYIDDFFKPYHLKTPHLTRDMVQHYVGKRENEAAQSQKKRICKIRQFAAFLESLGYEAYVIPKNNFKFFKTFTPYIFTREEIDALIAATDQMEYLPRYPQSHFIYPVLIRMLYGCGLRLSEALSLTMENVDLDSGILIIRHSKFNNSRLVPMSENLVKCCIEYVDRMNFPSTYEGYFFPSPVEGTYKNCSIYARFRDLLEQAGIRHGGRGRGPRLHDLRHTFAVHSLEQMVEKGFDIYCALPILSTYLGHRTTESTDKYVRLTSVAHADVIEALEPLYENLFPEVAGYEEE